MVVTTASAGNHRLFLEGGAMRTHRYLRRKAASDYLHETHGLDRAPSTLAKLAVIGGRPIFRRAGRFPLYSMADLDEWVASKLSPPMRSTSDVTSPSDSTTDGDGRSESGDREGDNDADELSNARNRRSV
jgi:hypothetical protein